MGLQTWESPRTRQAWSTTASPIILLLVCLVANIIALIVSIVINITSANEPSNDYAPDTGWALIMPAPSAALVWNLIDIVVCRFWVLPPVYTVSSSCILAALYAITGSLTGAFYSWDTIAWLPCLFFILNALIYVAFVGLSARALNRHKKRARFGGQDRMAGLEE